MVWTGAAFADNNGESRFDSGLTYEAVSRLDDNKSALGILYSERQTAVDGRSLSAVVIDQIAENSPLKGKEISPGDMIVAVNQKSFESVATASRFIAAQPPGASVDLTVLRSATGVAQTIQSAVISQDTMQFKGIGPKPPAGEPFGKGCAAGGVVGWLTVSLPGIFMAPFGFGATFLASQPLALKAAAFGCLTAGAGNAVAEEMYPSQTAKLYRRMM